MAGRVKRVVTVASEVDVLRAHIADLKRENDDIVAINKGLEVKFTAMEQTLKYAEDARASARESAAVLKQQLDNALKERDAYKPAALEVARLNGVLEGLERAGKIDPAPATSDPFTMGGLR